MLTKLKCAIVDDDAFCHEILHDLLRDCPIAELTATYQSPKKFLAEEPELNFDICLLDICMPGINGFKVADKLKKNNRVIIFISGVESKLVKALEMVEPIDVIPKPIKKERLYRALGKAYTLFQKDMPADEKIELFSVAEVEGKIRIRPSDINYVRTDLTDRRHKHIILKNGKKYMLMHCTLNKLLSFASSLVQINKAELISFDVFHGIHSDVITLDGIIENGRPKQVTLSRTFREVFENRAGIM